jgi:hypothetical protein
VAELREGGCEVFHGGRVSRELREMLNQLCWTHPDQNSNMDMPNHYNGMDTRMRAENPRWFNDET